MVGLEFADKSRWLSLRDACRLLDVNEATLRQWGDQGHLRVYRTPGGHRRFLREDVLSLTQQEASPAAHYEEGERRENPEGVALRRIRRKLHQDTVTRQPWYQSIEEEGRVRLRLFGRRLLSLLVQDIPPRRRSEALEEALLLGREYGSEMHERGVSLRDTVEAFILFRSMAVDSATGRAVTQALELADRVLVGIVESYEERLAAVGRNPVRRLAASAN